MNLHRLAAPAISAVNPFIPVTVKISAGQSAPSANGARTPLYATPGAFTASIAGSVLTVSAIATGKIIIGMTLVDSPMVLEPGTIVTGQLSGSAGGVGTYSVNKSQAVPSEAMTSYLMLRAQVQPVSWRDLQMVEGLNLGGTRVKIYLYGTVDGLVRSQNKGGDIIVIATGGQWDGTWLVAQNLEQFPDWVSAACTLQNNA